MTELRQAAQMALKALEWNYGTDLENIENCTAWLDKLNATIPALRQALAQPEQRPANFYLSPPQREWVGLTGEEARKFYEKYTDREELIYAIDEFLEEKNSG